MRYFTLFLLIHFSFQAQLLQDDFEGNSTINSWIADDAVVDYPFGNPEQDSFNPSSNVLLYHDVGGQYANVFFDSNNPILLSEESVFTLKIYVPSSGITGNQPNQISLKLQDNSIGAPWSTQTEIIHSIELDVWQEISFDFANDSYINLDPNSPDPLQRTDFNRVLLQMNGEDNNDEVLAYIDDFYFQGEDAPDDETNPIDDPVYDELVWSDEFDQDGSINTNKWYHQTILPNGNSWFNGEIQHYTDRLENSYVEDGIMHIVAKSETFTDQGVTKNYTSARLNSKFAFTYGRVEVKAKLPTGVGTWPAIWMLGKNIEELGTYWDNEGFGTTPWPACGEIDIMEHWGHNQNFIQSAMHTPSSFGGTVNHGGQVIPTASTNYHVYALDWYEDRMVFSVDDVVHYVYQPNEQNEATWPFDEEQFILLNIAIEPSIDPNFTESSMDIEYVRVYQESSMNTEEFEKSNELIVSPNPFKETFQIQVDESQLGSQLQLYNSQGKLLKQIKVSQTQTQLNLSEFSSGVYFLKNISHQNSKTIKVIKE
ncbi:MAG: family 16 glycosylhydrolase [Flavobacteriaceae bacterium]|nr:family 16 glycosylhydrolase [Flavobacteriaceae bacterium]